MPTQPNVLRVTGTEPYGDPEAAFAAAVRDGRSLLGLTQEQVRRRLLDNFGIDLSKTAMSRLEQGERPIRFNEVAALAQILKLNVFAVGQRKSEAEELDVAFVAATERLKAVERELDIASAAAASARNTVEAAEARLAMLKTRQRQLRDARNQLAHDLSQVADARKRFELLKDSDGDR